MTSSKQQQRAAKILAAGQDRQQQHSPMQRHPGGQDFTVSINGQSCVVSCELNTVVQMNPNRVAVQCNGRQLWCESLLAVRSSRGAPAELVACVNERLRQLQDDLTTANGKVRA